MTYREILKLYKNGQLDETKKEEVERDIEKQDAISEYLFDNSSEDIWDMISDGSRSDSEEQRERPGENPGEGPKDRVPEGHPDGWQEKDFAAEIQKSIRKAFIRLGVIVGGLVLAIVAFCFFALPAIADWFYYDPGEMVGEETNRMSLDMEVYTELTMPFSRRSNVIVEENGFGCYDIYIPQNVSYGDTGWHHAAGTIKRNKLTFYDSNVFCKMTGNAFDWFQIVGDLSRPLDELMEEEAKQQKADGDDGRILHGYAGGPEETKENLKKLEEGELYKAYFTLNRMLSYEDFIQLINEEDGLGEIWCAVRTNGTSSSEATAGSRFEEHNWGFCVNMTSSSNLRWDKEKYPELILWSVNEDGTDYDKSDNANADLMKTHFVSMLRYMEKQDTFCSMMDASDYDYGAAADYVEENGLTIYGFTAVTDQEEILKWYENDAIYSIAIEKYE